jgi:hypothetical protein
VDDAVIVRQSQRVSDLRGVLQRVVYTERASRQEAIVERLALDVLHDQEASAVFIADIVQAQM